MNTVTTFGALAEPSRLQIIELLKQGPFSVNEIAARLVIRQPQVSKHLRVLSEAGLVRKRPIARQRIYQLQAKPFEEIDAWLGTFSDIWNERFDNFDDYLKEMKNNER